MNRPRFFDRARVLQFVGYLTSGIALTIFLGWLAHNYTRIRIDWSFLIPLGAVIASGVPLATGMVGWLDKRLSRNDERLDQLEVLTTSLSAAGERSTTDRHELRKIILKLEARLESLRDTQVGSQIGELVELNRRVLRRLEDETE